MKNQSSSKSSLFFRQVTNGSRTVIWVVCWWAGWCIDWTEHMLQISTALHLEFWCCHLLSWVKLDMFYDLKNAYNVILGNCIHCSFTVPGSCSKTHCIRICNHTFFIKGLHIDSNGHSRNIWCPLCARHAGDPGVYIPHATYIIVCVDEGGAADHWWANKWIVSLSGASRFCEEKWSSLNCESISVLSLLQHWQYLGKPCRVNCLLRGGESSPRILKGGLMAWIVITFGETKYSAWLRGATFYVGLYRMYQGRYRDLLSKSDGKIFFCLGNL